MNCIHGTHIWTTRLEHWMVTIFCTCIQKFHDAAFDLKDKFADITLRRLNKISQQSSDLI